MPETTRDKILASMTKAANLLDTGRPEQVEVAKALASITQALVLTDMLDTLHELTEACRATAAAFERLGEHGPLDHDAGLAAYLAAAGELKGPEPDADGIVTYSTGRPFDEPRPDTDGPVTWQGSRPLFGGDTRGGTPPKIR